MQNAKCKIGRASNFAFCILHFAFLALPLAARTVDRVAAVVDRQVITVSEVTQMVELHFFARNAGESEDDYRHRVLESLIAQALRFRDVERFGAEEIGRASCRERVSNCV